MKISDTLDKLMQKTVLLIKNDMEVKTFFDFAKNTFLEEFPRQCKVNSMIEVEELLGVNFKLVSAAMAEYFLSSYYKDGSKMWNVIDIALNKIKFTELEKQFIRAFRDSHVSLYKVTSIQGDIILEDLIDFGQKAKIENPIPSILSLSDDIAVAARIIHFNDRYVMSDATMYLPTEIAEKELIPMIKHLSKACEAAEGKQTDLDPALHSQIKKIWVKEIAAYYAAFIASIARS